MRLIRPNAYPNPQPNTPWWDTYAIEFGTIPIITPATGAAFPQVLVSGAWKTVTELQVVVGGVWKTVTEVQVVYSGAWKTVIT